MRQHEKNNFWGTGAQESVEKDKGVESLLKKRKLYKLEKNINIQVQEGQPKWEYLKTCYSQPLKG